MKLIINGQTRDFECESLPLDQLLNSLGLEGRPVVVELDREPVLPMDLGSTIVRDGSSLEIVTIAAGG